LLPDRVPSKKLGVASGVKTFMDMLALILASLVAGNLIDPKTHDPSLIMAVVIGLIVASTAITVFGTPEESTAGGQKPGPTARSILQEFKDLFQVDFKANTAYWWLIAERFVFLLGIFGIQQFAQYYIGDVLKAANPIKATGDLMAALAIGLVVMALIGGWLTDRLGAKLVLVIASLVTGLGCTLLLLVTSEGSLASMGSVIGIGMGLFLTANWALANQLAPEAEAGKYLGLTNIATAGAGALGRLWGPILDGLNNAWAGDWVGYKAMFIFGTVCALLSILLLVRIPSTKNKK
jgi:MFS family permease